jgi:hypothetical protein
MSGYVEQLKKKIEIQELLCDFENRKGRMPTEEELRKVYPNEEEFQAIYSVAYRSKASRILSSVAYFLGTYALSVFPTIFDSEIRPLRIWFFFFGIWVISKLLTPLLRHFRTTRKLSFLLSEI